MDLVTIEDIAKRLGKSKAAVYQMHHRGELGEPEVRAMAWDWKKIKKLITTKEKRNG